MPVNFHGSSRKSAFTDPLRKELTAKSRSRSAELKRASTQEAKQVVPRNDLLPDLIIEQRTVVSLLPPPKRLRPFGLDDIIEAARVIEHFGFVQPIVVGRDGHSIIDGELRLEAARWLGMEEVPCLMLAHFTKAEEQSLRIALNRLGQRRSWDLDVLRTELEELILAEEDIDVLGLDAIELDQILIDEGVSEDQVPEPDHDHKPVAMSGDLWTLGDHRLLCGDATDPKCYGLLMAGELAQLLLADAPYNIEVSKIVSTRHREFAQGSGEMSDEQYEAFLSAFITASMDVMVEGALAFLFIDWRQLERMMRAGRHAGMELLNLIVWIKANAGMGSLYRSQHELVPLFKKPGDKHKNRIELGAKGRNRSNCWFVPGAGTLGTDAREMLAQHPTSKPVAMLVDALIDVTDPDDIVLDGFGGSGSTLIAAEKSRRRARLIEIDPAYCDVILKRWSALTGKQPVLEATGQTLAEVEQEGRLTVFETIAAEE